MEIEIGVGLIRLADPKRGGDLLERMQRVRQNVAPTSASSCPRSASATTCGWSRTQYRIKIADMPVAEGDAGPDACCWRSIPARRPARCDGIATREPAFDTPATWIDAGVRDQAEMYGYTVVEPAGVLATHLDRNGAASTPTKFSPATPPST